MHIRSILLVFIASIASLLYACGSEDSAQQTPDLTPPPGLDQPAPGPSGSVDPTGPVTPGLSSSGGSLDPIDAGDQTDGGTDTSDAGTVDTDSGTTDTDAGITDTDGGTTEPPPPPPTTTTVGCIQVSLVSSEGNTFCYQVTELAGCKDLSHWDLATNCTVLSGTEPVYDEEGVLLNSIESFVPGTDPKSGITGVKWNTDGAFTSDTFCVTVDGTVSTGEVQVASKCGLPIEYSTIAGPVCQ